MPTPPHAGFTAPTVGIFKSQAGVTIGPPLITGRLNIISRLTSHPITGLITSLQQAVAGRVKGLVVDRVDAHNVKGQGREREKS